MRAIRDAGRMQSGLSCPRGTSPLKNVQCSLHRRFRGQVRNELFRIENSDAETVRTPGSLSGTGMLVGWPEDARPDDAYPGNRLQGRDLSSAFQGRCWRLAIDLGSSL
jgi:hypothetical protein